MLDFALKSAIFKVEPNHYLSHIFRESIRFEIVSNFIYDMASVCRLQSARFDWLILGHYSPVMPISRLL